MSLFDQNWAQKVGGGDSKYTTPARIFGNIIDPMVFIERGIKSGNWDPSTSQEIPTPGDVEGATLDTTLADEERARQMEIIAQLQQQAQTGDPVALGQLQEATARASDAQSSMGQAMADQRGTGASEAMRNIMGGQAHAQQQGRGQADVLKSLTQQQAQKDLAVAQSGVRAQDIAQAQAAQAAKMAGTEAQVAAQAEKNKQAENVGRAAWSMVPGMDSGGVVAGRAQVAGDDSRNDTVPAMLSAGEIVIPRSHAGSPEAAAAFVRELQARQGVQRFANGGQAMGSERGAQLAVEGVGGTFGNWSGTLFGTGPVTQVPYTPLETGPANEMRGQSGALSDQLSASAAGRGPTAVGGRLKASGDQNLENAMAYSAQGGGGALGKMGNEAQRLAGESGMARAGETQQAQAINAQLAAQMRGQSLQQAEIDQKAKLNTTLINIGLDAAHRLAIMNTIGAMGQGVAAAGAAGITSGPNYNNYNQTPTTPGQLSALSSQAAPVGYETEASDWNNPYDNNSYDGRGGASDITSGAEEKAHGGYVGAIQRHYAEGGFVAPQSSQDAITSHLMSLPPGQLMSLGSTIGRLSGPPVTPLTARDIAVKQATPDQELAAKVTAENAAKYNAWKTSPEGQQSVRINEAEKAGRLGGLSESDLEVYRKGASEYGDRTPAHAEEKFVATPAPTSQVTTAPSPAKKVGSGGAGYGGGTRPMVDKYQPQIDELGRTQREQVSEQGRIQGEAAGEKASVMEQAALDAAAADVVTSKMRADHAAKMQEAEQKYQTAVDKYSSAEIDPSRFWGTKSTGDKILAGIGLALGAFGGAKDGVNHSVAILNQAIDRDIEAQKSNIVKLGETASRQSQLLAIMRQNFGDEAQAQAATKASMLQTAEMKARAMAARADQPLEKAKANALADAVGIQIAQHSQASMMQADAKAKEESHWNADYSLKRRQLDMMAGKAGAPPMQAKKDLAVLALDKYEQSTPGLRAVALDHAGDAMAAAMGVKPGRAFASMSEHYKKRLTHIGSLTGSGQQKAAQALRDELAAASGVPVANEPDSEPEP